MANPPLWLNEVAYLRVVVEARQDFDPNADDPGAVHPRLRIQQSARDPRDWKAELRVEVRQDRDCSPPKYEVDITAVGVFSIHPEFPENRMPKLIATTGTSLLYSGVRDFLMTITARGPWGPYMLPTTSFADLEPTPRGPGEEIADSLHTALKDRGPLRMTDLEKILDVPGNKIRPVLNTMRDRGEVTSSGKGPGMRYRIAEPDDRVAEPE